MWDRDRGAASVAAVPVDAAAHAFDQLKEYNGQTNSWGKYGALVSTVGMLRGKYEKVRCNSDGVSDCVRCQVMFLVSAMERLLAASTICPGCGGVGKFHNHPCPLLAAGLGRAASGIEAGTGETVQHDSTEGESPTAATSGGDAQPPSGHPNTSTQGVNRHG